MLHGTARSLVEFNVTAEQSYRDIFNEIDVDFIFDGPGSKIFSVPAFWAGGKEFRVRFAASEPGRYTYRSVCTNTTDRGLHGHTGQIEIAPYDNSDNPLYRHGRLRVEAIAKRTLEHEDGTPFLWLADTWWMGLSRRLIWPSDFRILAADRAAKGFSVIQIVAGLYPDMPAFDQRGVNEAGFPWEKDYFRINPAYFDMADLRIEWLVRSGLVPCIVGCWGYFLPWMGIEKMKKHWRNLVARYGALPVVWCLAGEATMPYYLSENKEADTAFQKKGWTELAAYVRQIDPWHNLITIHPTHKGRDQVEDPALLDFEMLQTWHGDRQALAPTVNSIVASRACQPIMPVLDGEVCYEGLGEACRQEVQRYLFWAAMLSGACGHTYGANGIWQVNTREKPYGPSPHGMAWGDTPWEEAFMLPGSSQLGIGKRILERFAWWRFEPHPEWVEPHWTTENYFAGYAAGIPGEARIIYLPAFPGGRTVVKWLEQDVKYRAALINPVNGRETALGNVMADAAGDWTIQEETKGALHFSFPLFQDWLVILERV